MKRGSCVAPDFCGVSQEDFSRTTVKSSSHIVGMEPSSVLMNICADNTDEIDNTSSVEFAEGLDVYKDQKE